MTLSGMISFHCAAILSFSFASFLSPKATTVPSWTHILKSCSKRKTVFPLVTGLPTQERESDWLAWGAEGSDWQLPVRSSGWRAGGSQ